MSTRQTGYARDLAQRISLVKVALAVANLLVLTIDRAAPRGSSEEQVYFGAAVLFLMYMALAWSALRRRWVELRLFQQINPVLDVIAVLGLILSTGGYMSPFNLWFAVIVVSTGFSSSPMIPVTGAVMAMGAQMVIGAVHQSSPIDPGVFAVRTFFLLGFASLIAMLSNQIVRQSEALQAITRFGQEVELSTEDSEAIQHFESFLGKYLAADSVELSLSGVGPEDDHTVGLHGIGVCRITRRHVLRQDEREFVRVLADRLRASLRRIELGHELISAAAREERQRYADELHDTHLQTLAAVDLQVELASRSSDLAKTGEELREIRRTVREAAKRTRDFIESVEEHPPTGPAVIRDVLNARCPGSTPFFDENAELTEGQWRAVQMLVQEGVNNALRHASAERVQFELRTVGGETEATLDADGKQPPANLRYGYGLRRLETIVRANNGCLSLTSGIDGGSRLRATFHRGGQD